MRDQNKPLKVLTTVLSYNLTKPSEELTSSSYLNMMDNDSWNLKCGIRLVNVILTSNMVFCNLLLYVCPSPLTLF